MRLVVLLLALAGLSACGVEGPPEQPERQPRVTIKGEVGIGVSGRI